MVGVGGTGVGGMAVGGTGVGGTGVGGTGVGGGAVAVGAAGGGVGSAAVATVAVGWGGGVATARRCLCRRPRRWAGWGGGDRCDRRSGDARRRGGGQWRDCRHSRCGRRLSRCCNRRRGGRSGRYRRSYRRRRGCRWQGGLYRRHAGMLRGRGCRWRWCRWLRELCGELCQRQVARHGAPAGRGLADSKRVSADHADGAGDQRVAAGQAAPGGGITTQDAFDGLSEEQHSGIGQRHTQDRRHSPARGVGRGRWQKIRRPSAA